MTAELALLDKDVYPTDEVITTTIGKTRPLWDSAFAYLRDNHPDFIERWTFYNDGKRWLMNVSRKKKTVFWLGVLTGSFRATCYFTEKARQAIKASSLSDELKQQYLDPKLKGKLRGITITFRKKSDIAQFKTLIELKLSMK
jgi:hypothetical protein